MQTETKPRAFSYSRFSTPEQAKGYSEERQTEAAREYAERHHLDLDTSLKLHDAGVSAFRGKNAKRGSLRRFLDLVDAGDVRPGSYLLVENIDRVSRQGAWETVTEVIAQLVNRGVIVVTLSPEQVYSRVTVRDPMVMFGLMLTAQRAHGESERKGDFARKTWRRKRARALEEPLTHRGPSWLELDAEAKTWKRIPERVAVVQRIYAEALEGRGTHAIAERLNREGVPVFGRGRHWHRSFVLKLLDSPAVGGTLIPHTFDAEEQDGTGKPKGRTPLAAVHNYYPPAVDADTYSRVRALRGSTGDPRGTPRRGAHANRPVRNLLGGMARCALCGGSMTLVNKGDTPKTRGPMALYLVCSAARTGAGCHYAAVPLSQLEPAMLEAMPAVLANAPAGDNAPELDAELEALEARMLGHMEAVDAAREELKRGHSPTATRIVRQLDAEWRELRAQRDALESRRDAAAGALVGRRLAELGEALSTPDLDRTHANALMRVAFTSAVIDPDWKTVCLTFAHGGAADFSYGFPTDPPPARNVPRADGSPPPPGY